MRFHESSRIAGGSEWNVGKFFYDKQNHEMNVLRVAIDFQSTPLQHMDGGRRPSSIGWRSGSLVAPN
ncbi:MAG: hypothetical protein JXR73_18230 [Candidatus Omnitrophica bacterium]|nr:hypothetical protein [Candidatus Omnitrophota bacterium]